MKREDIMASIWDGLEELDLQMTSSAAEGLTGEQMEFVDERLKAIIQETRLWFPGLDTAP